MEEKIEILKSLFSQRDVIDRQIAEIIGGEPKKRTPKSRKEAVKPKRKNAKRPKQTKEVDYRCEDCQTDFSSDAHYLSVRCPECSSNSPKPMRIRSAPNGHSSTLDRLRAPVAFR